MNSTNPTHAADEQERLEEQVEGEVKAAMEEEPGAAAESWEEIGRRVQARIKADMARLIGAQPDASWAEIGRQAEGRTKAAFGGWAGASPSDDWDTVGRKIEARIRERAARWSGVEQADEARWSEIGRKVNERMRRGLGAPVGAPADADWRTVASRYRERIDADLRRTFGHRAAEGAAPEAAPAEAAAGEGTAAAQGTEGKGERTRTEEFRVTGTQLLEKVKKLVHEGNVRRVIVKQDDRVLIEFPLTVGVVGALIAPTLAAIGAIAALVTECTIVVERAE